MKGFLKTLLKGLLSISLLFIMSSGLCIAESRILSKVGGEIITSNDLERRYVVFVKMNNLSPTPQEVEGLKFQLLHSLINERVIIQEARRLRITVGDKDVEEAIENIDRSQNLPKGSFFKHQEQYGTSRDELQEQIRVKLIWERILSDVIVPTYGQAAISDAELNEFIVQSHPSNMQIKGFMYKFGKENLKMLKKLQETNENNLCDVKALQKLTGFSPRTINSSLDGIEQHKIRQLASFAKEERVVLTSEENDKTVALILCKKKPTVSEEELEKIRAEMKNRKMESYTEYYLKNLKKKASIRMNQVE